MFPAPARYYYLHVGGVGCVTWRCDTITVVQILVAGAIAEAGAQQAGDLMQVLRLLHSICFVWNIRRTLCAADQSLLVTECLLFCISLQDFKTAHLLGVPPSAQLVAMLLGSAVSVPLSVGAYLLYTSAWEVPGPTLPAPTAQIWLDMAKLVSLCCWSSVSVAMWLCRWGCYHAWISLAVSA